MPDCIQCKQSFKKVNRIQKFCSNKCCKEYHSKRNLKHKRKVSLKYYNEHYRNKFPKWRCSRCGTEIMLDFHPIEEPDKLRNIICPKCKKTA